jgi:hypothetical protein
MTTKEIIAAFEHGAVANRQDPCRVGNVIHLPAQGDVIMTGDLHGHVRNFERICAYARLDEHPQRHLVLHELLHGGPGPKHDECESYLLLAQAAALKARFPAQVHFLLSNHESAQAIRGEVLKNGQAMVRAVNNAISTAFTVHSALVQQALQEFIISMPLVVRTANRIWLSHTLPSERHVEYFEDPHCLDKPLTLEVLATDPGVRALTWDRAHHQKALDRLRLLWHVDVFVIGHKPEASGARTECDSLIILASDHAHGKFMHFSLGVSYDRDALFDCVLPLAAV